MALTGLLRHLPRIRRNAAADAVLVFQGESEQETHWRVLSLDLPTAEGDGTPLEPITFSYGRGASTYQFLLDMILAQHELRTEPGTSLALATLLRVAARDRRWRFRHYGDSFTLSPEDRSYLRRIADAIEEHGLWKPGLEVQTEPEPQTPLPERNQLPIPSVGHYAALQEALALNRFTQAPDSPFPRARLEKGGVHGHAELRQITPEEELLLPPEETEALARQMWKRREELSDRDADALDAVSACWLQSASNPTDRVPIFIDEILRMRGLKPKRSGTGRRGGFEVEQRAEVFRSLLHLQDVWLSIAEATVYEDQAPKKPKARRRALQSRAFVMTDRVGQQRLDGRMDVEAVLVTPGTAFGRFLFGPGRQVALLSVNALRFDPARQRPEKRLLRYLSWQWRIGASQGDFLRTYRVETLLEETGLLTSEAPPSRVRSRLEQCLDTLRDHGDIAAWQYAHAWDEEQLPRKGWFSQWLGMLVSLEAPEAIKVAYRGIESAGAMRAPKKLPGRTSWSERLRLKRQELNLSQSQAAEEIGISQPLLSRIEAGRREPTPDVAHKLARWLGP